MATKQTGKSEMFISEVIKARESLFGISSRKLVIVCDNASVHKSNKVKDYLSNAEVKLLTILLGFLVVSIG